MDDALTSSVRELVTPILAEHDAELVELTCRPRGGVLMIRLLVDKVRSVKVQDCARLNQLIDLALEASHLIEQSFTLEVSSPGLDRPLVSQRDYERAIGEDLKLRIAQEGGGVRESEGQLLAVQPEAIVLVTSSGNVTVPIRTIQSATKVIKL